MTRAAAVIAAALAAAPLAAQTPDAGALGSSAQGGAIFETYSLGPGLAFDRITELVIPVSVVQRFGRRLVVDVATAYAKASVRTVDGDIDLSGVVDTDVRAAIALVPGRVILTLVGTLPTGQATVPDTTLPLYGATATDLFGFTVPSFGGGGGVTAGLATAFRLGATWAAGVGASYRYSGTFVPVQGGGELAPGAEGRFRLGVEGPLGRRGGTYLRGALVFSHSAPDVIADSTESAIGDRVLGYVALNVPVGRGALSLYAWDMRRLRAAPAADMQVPRGNVLAVGARLDRPLSPAVAIAPAVEVRHELSGSDSLVVLGWLVRPGMDVRLRLGSHAVLVTSARYAFGQVRDEGVTVSVRGPRLGLAIEWLW